MGSISGITVIIATYNGDKFLEQQLLSVLDQDMAADEIIVCDDISTDNTKNILESFYDKGLIKYYINEKRLGVVDNFKKAIGLAKSGNYIAFCDQDDVWLPQKLSLSYEKMLSIDTNEKPALVYSNLSMVNENLEIINDSFWQLMSIWPKKHCLAGLFIGNVVTGCTMLVNASMKKYFIEMPSNLCLHDEWIAFIAMSLGNYAHIDKPLMLYRQHNLNVSNVMGNIQHASVFKNKIKSKIEVLRGKSLLFKLPLNIAGVVYTLYKNEIPELNRKKMEDFLKLSNSPFYKKKIYLYKLTAELK